MINKENALKQLDDIHTRYQEARKSARNEKLEGVPTSKQYAILTAMSAAIDRLAPPDSRYVQNAQKVSEKYGPSYNISAIYGIFKALRDDYRSGYLQEIEELIHADIFSDFLDMAEYLLNKGFKDPSAVLIGGY